MCPLCLQLNRRSSLLLGFAETLRSMAALGSQILAFIPQPLLAAPAEVLGVRIPDSDVAVAATDFAQAAMSPSPALFNHCRRSFVLGMIDARKRALKVDEEACYVAAMLHDIALMPEHAGDLTKTFEANGAELAETFVLARGFSADRADKVAKAILLHAGDADGMGPDIEFVMWGTGQDVLGPQPDQLTDQQLAAIEGAIPRLRFKEKFLALMKDHVNRTKTPTWTAAFARGEGDFFQRFVHNRWSE
jgi:HD domain